MCNKCFGSGRILHDAGTEFERTSRCSCDKEPTYRGRLRDEAGDEAAAMADAFLDANPDCAF